MIHSDSLRHDAAAERPGHGTAEPDGALVVVQPSVLATVDHAFGNLFQRVYHLVRVARSGGGGPLSALEESVHELQSLLELFVDYVAPTPVESRSLQAADLLVSFERHLAEALGAERTHLGCRELPGVVVLADPARMARVFQLLSGALHRVAGATEAVRGHAALSADGSHLEITFEHLPRSGCAEAELRWALAQKLIDLQGGELRQGVGPDGVQWTLRVPMAAS